jgi:hypothetical protein
VSFVQWFTALFLEHSFVPWGHVAHLQVELVFEWVSGDGHSALEGMAVVSVLIISYAPHPL